MFSSNDAETIKKEVKTALNNAWDMNRCMNDDPFAPIKPEYLTTAEVGRALIGKVGVVRLEESTTAVANWSCFHPAGHKYVGRKGKVDVTIYNGYRDFRRPVAVVENKNFIKGFSGIKEDVLRNSELLLAKHEKKGGTLALGISTFYKYVDGGVLKNSLEQKADQSFTRIKRKLDNLVTNPKITKKLSYWLLTDKSYSSEADASDPDEYGRPACDGDETFLVYAGVVILQRPDRLV